MLLPDRSELLHIYTLLQKLHATSVIFDIQRRLWTVVVSDVVERVDIYDNGSQQPS